MPSSGCSALQVVNPSIEKSEKEIGTGKEKQWVSEDDCTKKAEKIRERETTIEKKKLNKKKREQ